MKIRRQDYALNPAWNSTASGRSAASTPPACSNSATPTDRTQLSNLSSYLASALSGSRAHVAKLAKLAAAVSSGEYHVDPAAVSGSIIQHAIEFGGSAYWALST